MLARSSVIAAVLLAVLTPRDARGTYSIVGTDTATRQIGAAGTSCVAFPVIVIYGPAPGHGAINAQALLNTAGRDRGAQLLNMDVAPVTIVTMITAASFDANAASRQYGVVDLMGRAAGFTGTAAPNARRDRQGIVGTFNYSAQGNTLTSVTVVDNEANAFESSGCDLAD